MSGSGSDGEPYIPSEGDDCLNLNSQDEISTENDTEMDIENMPSINDEEAPMPGTDPPPEAVPATVEPKPEPPPPKPVQEEPENVSNKSAPKSVSEEGDKSISHKSQSKHDSPNEQSADAEPQSQKSEKSQSKKSVSRKSESSSQKAPLNGDTDKSESNKRTPSDKTITSATKSTIKQNPVKGVVKGKGSGGSTAKPSNTSQSRIEQPQSRSSKSSKTKRSSYSEGKLFYPGENVILPRRERYSTQERTSDQHSDDSYRGSREDTRSRGHSTKHSSSYRKPKDRQKFRKESSSLPTFACAETTPSMEEYISKPVRHKKKKPKNMKKKEEFYSESDGSMSVSSGLESLRDIFFDVNDSHKGYLAHYPNIISDETYQSHNECLSKISNPSFNSHVDLTKLSENKSPDITPVTDITHVEPPSNDKMQSEVLSTISEHVTQENKCSDVKSPSPKMTPVRDLLSPELDYISDIEEEEENNSKHVDFIAGSNVTSLALDESPAGMFEEEQREEEREEYTDSGAIRAAVDEMCSDGRGDNIIRDIDKKYLSFTSNTLLCDLSNIVPNIKSFIKMGSRHILNKEVCLEFMCWLENLNQLYMSNKYMSALEIFKRQESRFKIVLYECLQVAQGCGLDIGFERVAAMAHMSLDIIYTMLPYCDGIKWYSQMVAGAKRANKKLAEAYMLMCMGQLMIYNGDSFEAQRHLQAGLSIVKNDFIGDKDVYNCLKHLTGFSVVMCDCNDITERERGLIKMTESLVMTRNVYGSNSLETAMGRLHIGIAYKSLYEDTTLRLEGLDYVERAHEVLEDKLGHHPYMGICVQTLAQYHDAMLNINFSSEYNQAVKCYNLAVNIHRTSLGEHSFTVRALTQLGDFYHRMADYRMAGKCLTSAHSMATVHAPTDVVYALSCFQLGLYHMDEQCTEHDIYRGQNLLTSAANLLSKYGVTYQRATMLQHMGIASEEAGLRYTLYKQESENIKTAMFGTAKC